MDVNFRLNIFQVFSPNILLIIPILWQKKANPKEPTKNAVDIILVINRYLLNCALIYFGKYSIISS